MRAVRIFSSLLLVAALASSALGCDSSKGGGAVEAAVTAAPLTVEECSACGMVVAEQPAPRVQVVHRDGERMFLCSVGDSVHHLADGSRHGAAKGVFVEVLDPAADPTVTDPTKRPWRDATKSSFVVGVKRQGVMGPPVLAYETLAQAQAVAKRTGGEVKTWDEVRNTLLAPKPDTRAGAQPGRR